MLERNYMSLLPSGAHCGNCGNLALSKSISNKCQHCGASRDKIIYASKEEVAEIVRGPQQMLLELRRSFLEWIINIFGGKIQNGKPVWRK